MPRNMLGALVHSCPSFLSCLQRLCACRAVWAKIYPKITSKLPWEQLTNGCDIWTRQSHISDMRDSASVAGERRWLETVHLVLRRLQDRTHGSSSHVGSSSQIKEPYTIPILNWWGLFLLSSLFLCPGKELFSLEEHPNSPNVAIEHESLKWFKQDQPSELIYVYKSTNMMKIWNGWWYDVYWFWKKEWLGGFRPFSSWQAQVVSPCQCSGVIPPYTNNPGTL